MLLLSPFVLIPIGISHLISRLISRKIMLLDVVENTPGLDELLGPIPLSHNTLLLRHPDDQSPINWDKNLFTVITLTESETPFAQAAISNARTRIVIEDFEQRAFDPHATIQKAGLIERFLNEHKTVILVSRIDPLRFALPVAAPVTVGAKAVAVGAIESLSGAVAPVGASQTGISNSPDSTQESQRRWAGLIAKFVRVQALDAANPTVLSDSLELRNFYGLMKAGDQPRAYLERIGLGIMAASSNSNTGARPNRDERIIEQATELARPYHFEIWEGCSTEEKITLFELALGGFISASNPDLRPLTRRGLVFRDPTPRLMDEPFRRFVVKQGKAEDVTVMIRNSQSGAWHDFKLPLLLIFLFLAAFLLLSQRETFDSTVTFLSTLSGAALALLKLADLFGREKIASMRS
jgi:hypothetical protein